MDRINKLKKEQKPDKQKENIKPKETKTVPSTELKTSNLSLEAAPIDQVTTSQTERKPAAPLLSDESSQESLWLNEKLMNYKEIKQICTFLNASPTTLLWIIASVSIIFLIHYADELLFIPIGVLVPVLSSLKAAREDNVEETNRLLKYWTVFFLLVTLDSAIKVWTTVSYSFVLIKLVITVLSFLPSYTLSDWIYDKILKRLFKKYKLNIEGLQSSIEDSLLKVQGLVEKNK